MTTFNRQKFLLQFSHIVSKWWRKYIVFSKAVTFILGLVASHGLVEYSMLAILVTHLTDDWSLILPEAAKTVNVYEGVSAVLVIVVAYLSDTRWGCFKTVLLCNTLFILGLALLWFVAWRLQITTQKKWKLYAALFLISIGKAGRDVPLKAFLARQLKQAADGETTDTTGSDEIAEKRRKIWWRVAWIVGIVIATVFFSNTSWERLTKMSTLAVIVGFVLFLVGIPFYARDQRPTGGHHIRNTFGVWLSALLKGHLRSPHSPIGFNDDSTNQLQLRHNTEEYFCYNSANQLQIRPPITYLRWLDKAAIIERDPSQNVGDHQVIRRWRLYTVAQVKEVKSLISLVPLWSTFILYSLIQATGSTFFFEQANQMDNHIGSISQVPIVVFVVISSFTSSILSILLSILLPVGAKAPRKMFYRIGFGMFAAVICCITSWRVEVRRLHFVHIQRNDDFVRIDIQYISVFWLVPQFFLLGLMDGFAGSGLLDFYECQASESLKKYGQPFGVLASGIGKFASVIFIIVFRFWFAEDVNTSRLDLYYAMLAGVSLANLCFYCVMAYKCVYIQFLDSEADEEEGQGNLMHEEKNKGEENGGDHEPAIKT